jgi:Fe2+ transport system protein B
LAVVGKGIQPVFEPMGVEKNNWPAAVAVFTGDTLFVGDVDLGTCEMAQEAARNLKDAIREAIDGMPGGT